MSIHGIDVSRFQGSIDWEAVRAGGIQFAMIRAGYGEGTVDQEFQPVQSGWAAVRSVLVFLCVYAGNGQAGGGILH